MRIWLIIVVFVSCIILGVGLTLLINKFKTNKFKKKYKIFFSSLFSFGFLLISLSIYLLTYSHATPDAKNYLSSSSHVNVTKDKNGYLFETTYCMRYYTIVIFYPGAKVELSAYAPLLHNIAENGIDVYALDFPFHFPFFDINAADKVLKKHKPNKCYMMGHSLGGSMAASYISKTNYSIDGLILLASYSTSKINTNVLSIYGDKDGVLNMKNYQKNRDNYTNGFQEKVIEGGNHTNFGLYPLQSGDNKADITFEKQQEITVNEIVDFIEKDMYQV